MEENFWNFFNEVAAPKLSFRAVSFRKIFEYLDSIEAPINIVETGCIRVKDNWNGDGQSTILFDRYVCWRGRGSKVFSVDIDPNAVALCRTLVGDAVQVTAGDSVGYLSELAASSIAKSESVALFYLDSFDVDFAYWFPSAVHHLKELVAASRMIKGTTLVVVDDCLQTATVIPDESGEARPFLKTVIGGKGRLVAEVAEQMGATLLFSHYQAGWIGFNRGSV